MLSHSAILPARKFLRGAYQKRPASSVEGDIRCTQGEKLPATCGEVTFVLSLEGWRGLALTSIDGERNVFSFSQFREKEKSVSKLKAALVKHEAVNTKDLRKQSRLVWLQGYPTRSPQAVCGPIQNHKFT